MGTSFLVSVKSLVRTPSVIVWVLAFPLIMSAIFLFMFSGMRTDGVVDPVPVALVAPADEKDDAPAGSFTQVAEALAEPGEDQLLDLRRVGTADEAEVLLASGEIDGYFEIASDGAPALTVGSAYTLSSADGETAVNRTILETVASSYVQSRALLEEVARRDPAALADPAAVTDALGIQVAIERVQITHARPEEIVRYYYALLGMGALMASQAGMLAVAYAQPGVSALGARRAVSGTSRLRQLAGCALGAWAVSTVTLTLAFAFLRLVAGVDFGGREGLALVAVAVCALLATALGACVGALPLSAGISARSGILTALTCVLSLFAGLYGTAAMELADNLAHTLPWTSWVNPTKLVCDTFYALYYYTSLAPFAARLAACVAGALALLAVAGAIFRRQSYEHL
ncbi:MAG TPA: ABC transporter permease [Candidatus Olsenella stercoravium]|uniref:ABC transporter permease n=1 Tax=Candidatus Olsenella stercoravium TaxID=2838713 RepID=A0A9D2IQ35_9ACTN|nr:ABC transporter permease [Candidatus Olsenella stercoravium]